MRRRIGGLLALGVLVAGGYWVARFALPSDRVPFDKWSTGLGPRLWTTWWLLGTFVLATLSFGHLLVRRASRAPRDGAWALAFSSGTIVFAVAIGLFAWLGWLGHPFFWVLPLTMTLAGLPSLRDAVVETRAQWVRSPPFSAAEVLALLFGGVCLGLLLLQVITPDNVNYDAMWYHLRSAERNALAGGAVRTPEGDILLTLPSSTSWLYTWAFLAPGLPTDDKVVLALHLELAVFIGTLATLPPLVRALVPGRERRATRVTWIALFFFPSIFVYDTGLMGGADHMVALWAGAIVLAWVQARERDDVGSWALLGLQLVGASAKYSSLYLLVPLVPMMLVDAAYRGRGRVPVAARLRGLLVAAVIPLLLTVPYWLRNWVWHHNPIFPEAAWLFPNTPWIPEVNTWRSYWEHSGLFSNAVTSTGYRLEATFAALFDYHKKIYGWTDMMGDQSPMGSGYFLSLLVLPFLPERRRLLALAVLLNLGIVVWFNLLQHHMRYLTVLTPLMAAGMAATAISLWELGAAARAAVVGVVVLLLSAYADVPFRHTHRIFRHSSPVANADDVISRRGPPAGRIKMWTEIGATLPPAAKPLVHGIETHLGLPRLTVTDCGGMQVGINYAKWGSVAAVWENLRQMGVTHFIWSSDVEQPDTITGEALWRALAKSVVNKQVLHGINVGELPAKAPAEPGTHILYVGCNEHWPTGVYSLAALAQPPPPLKFPWPPLTPDEPLTKETWQAAASEERIGWVVTEDSCKAPAPAGYTPMGLQVILPSNLRYYVRQR